MASRRYDDEEMRAIFAQAADASTTDATALRREDGRTLEELVAIGREAGLDPSAILSAARTLDQPVVPERRFLGQRIGVGRTVYLERTLSREEWEQLVVRLRETFDARGVVVEQGGLRQWSNGNLQVLVEPTATGDRVRMRTRNANAQATLTIGLIMGGTAALLTGIAAATGEISEPRAFVMIAPLAVLSVATVSAGLARLRGWAARRVAQMDAVASQLLSGRSE
jgi:hypothetical protein